MTMFSRPWSRWYADDGVGSPSFVADCGLWNDRQAAAAEQVEACLGDIDLVRVAYCDPHGLARSKTVPAEVFRTVLRNGMDFSPGPFLFDTGHAVAVDFLSPESDVGVAEITGAGDFIVVPDPRTFQVLRRTAPSLALVLGDEYLRDGTPHPLATRNVLRRVCERFRTRDLAPVVGLEVEWYLTRLLDGPPGNAGNGFGLQGQAPAVEAVNSGYQFNLDSYSDSVAPVTDPLASMLTELGLPLRTMEHESGPGQVETTFSPMFALDAADAMLLFRTLVKQECRRRGFHASFMALPRIEGFDPSGWHLHQSVASTKTGGNIFAAHDGAEVSAEGFDYLHGLLSAAREFCLLSVPTINGYRRLDPRFVLSPSTTNWSVENRNVMIRVLGGSQSAHMENRIGEPCANPYLAMAAQLSAGLDGMNGIDGSSGSVTVTNLPRSLREALGDFRASQRIKDLLGEPLTACLALLKQSEVNRFETWCASQRPSAGSSAGNGAFADEVTEWEHREYFEIF
jgi:glutamine synthetase